MRLATKGCALASTSSTGEGDLEQLPRCRRPRGRRAQRRPRSRGDHDRGQRELAEYFLQLDPHGRARVRVERGQRLVHQQHLGVPRERARGQPAGALRPTAPRAGPSPDARSGGAPAARRRVPCRRRRRSARRSGAGTARSPGTRTRPNGDPGRGSRARASPTTLDHRSRSALRPGERGRRSHAAPSSSPSRTARRSPIAPDVERYAETKGAERDGDVDTKRIHAENLTPRSSVKLTRTSRALIASAVLKLTSNSW